MFRSNDYSSLRLANARGSVRENVRHVKPHQNLKPDTRSKSGANATPGRAELVQFGLVNCRRIRMR